MKLEIHRFGVLSDRHPHPLVFVHGEWHGAWCWEEKFVPFFRRQGFLCVTLDLRGHGGSDGGERLNKWTLNDYVADLTQMVEEVDQSPILVGHSMGATISQMFASEHEVDGMVLLCPIPTLGYNEDAKRLFKDHPWVTFMAEMTGNAGRLVDDEGLVKKLFFSSALPANAVCRYFCRFQGESMTAIRQCVKGVGALTMCNDPPVLIIGRDHDELVSESSVHQCTCQCHGMEVILPGTGHDMMLDEGWEGAADTMLAWASANAL
jgi:pimeloyl-ACP methyl ester carboxylesterase